MKTKRSNKFKFGDEVTVRRPDGTWLDGTVSASPDSFRSTYLIQTARGSINVLPCSVRVRRKPRVRRSAFQMAAYRAYRQTKQFQVEQLRRDRAYWQRKATLASNKMLEVQAKLDELLNTLAKERGETEAK